MAAHESARDMKRRKKVPPEAAPEVFRVLQFQVFSLPMFPRGGGEELRKDVRPDMTVEVSRLTYRACVDVHCVYRLYPAVWEVSGGGGQHDKSGWYGGGGRLL